MGLVALEHLLRPDLPPGEHFVSEYANGWTRPVQTVAFLAWAAATGACAVLAARVPRRKIARALTVLALGAATVGLVMTALWPTETVAGELPAGVERTLGGRLHDLGTLAILAGLLVAALASLRLVPSTRYRLTVLALGRHAAGDRAGADRAAARRARHRAARLHPRRVGLAVGVRVT